MLKTKTIVTFTVQTFRDTINGALRHGSLTDYSLAIRPIGKVIGAQLKKPDTIFVMCGRAQLKFEVVGPGAEYAIMGIAFAGENRAAGSGAIPLSTSASPVKGSPFKALELQNGVLALVDVVPLPPAGKPRRHKLYKFTLLIQRVRDGAIGIIDPFLDNEN